MTAPLVVHVIHRLQVGGLENGLVNLINHMPPERYRHAIVCMTESTEFRNRIRRPDVEVYELHKSPGHDLSLYWRLWRLLRTLRPAVVHTRNIGTLECQALALLAGVRARVHGEHGRDMSDLHGKNTRYIALRRTLRPWLAQFITVSRDLRDWLVRDVGVPERQVTQIYNGVDMQRFRPRNGDAASLLPAAFAAPGAIVAGTVGRMSGEKDQMTLVRAFARAAADHPRANLRLVLVGDGPARAELENAVAELGIGPQVWLAGNRADVPDLLRALDIFVLPSLGEGISNTILEAMACGLPVLATRVGGNPELVVEGETGVLVAPAEPDEMARALQAYIRDPELMRRHGHAGRARIEREFSMDAMVTRYMGVYDAALSRHGTERA
jgi:sugar transferase (PEP-CTERM/EpsH1 system associated)